MKQPSIYFNNFYIHEPITVITDLLLCLFCIIIFLKLGKTNAKYWKYFFLTLSFSTFFGALGHGLFTDTNNILQFLSRIASTFSVFSASLASMMWLDNKLFTRYFKPLIYIQFITAIVLIFILNEFRIVVYNSFMGLGLLVAGIQTYLMTKGSKGSLFIIIGILINALTGIIHSQKISISKWFNHNDISHLILIIGLYMMYLGIINFKKYEMA